jgi:hypothetical protein
VVTILTLLNCLVRIYKNSVVCEDVVYMFIPSEIYQVIDIHFVYQTLEQEKALRERGEGSGAAFMVEDDDDSDEERLRRLAFLRGLSSVPVL